MCVRVCVLRAGQSLEVFIPDLLIVRPALNENNLTLTFKKIELLRFVLPVRDRLPCRWPVRPPGLGLQLFAHSVLLRFCGPLCLMCTAQKYAYQNASINPDNAAYYLWVSSNSRGSCSFPVVIIVVVVVAGSVPWEWPT